MKEEPNVSREDDKKHHYKNIKTITVYAASMEAVPTVYLKAAEKLGAQCAKENVNIKYGGGKTGLMGHMADTCLENGGKITSVIPDFMVKKDWHHPKVEDTIVTPDMHSRKMELINKSNGIVALPGGIGTFEELFEVMTWRKLDICTLPIVIVNINNYYEHLLAQLKKSTDEHFVRARQYAVVNRVEDILPKLQDYYNKQET